MNAERRGPPASADSPHLDDDTLERFAVGELDSGARARVRAHAGACPSCAALLRGVTLLQKGAHEFDPGAPRATRATSRTVWIPIGVAAAIAIAVLVPMMTARRPAPSLAPSSTRDARGDAPVPIAPTGQLADAPARFEWRPLKGASVYELLLFREDGTLLWQQRAAGTSLERRADLQLLPGRYYWRVRALSDENAPAESPLTPFEIRKP